MRAEVQKAVKNLNVSKGKVLILFLDDGHGTATKGKRTPKFKDGTQMKENEFNREVVYRVIDNLGYSKKLSIIELAPSDIDVPLKDRTRLENEVLAEAKKLYGNGNVKSICISIHANALKGYWGTWGGIETYHYPKSKTGKVLADILHKHIIQGTKLRDRKVKSANFHMLRETDSPACLVECGFMDNRYEAELLKSEAYRKECADEITQAVMEYFKLEKEETVDNGLTNIMGKSKIPAEALAEYLIKVNPSPKLCVPALELANYFIEEGEKEGVRGDVAFVQALKETGYFRYGGQVLPAQNNFCGLGATNNSPVGKGAWFKTARDGVKAQIQHLKAYGSTEPLNGKCIDPRFHLVPKGWAEYFEYLGAYENPKNRDKIAKGKFPIGWAYKGETYGHSIIKMYDKIFDYYEENKENFDLYKLEGIDYLYENGYIEDKEEFLAIQNEPLPTWLNCILLMKIIEKCKDRM